MVGAIILRRLTQARPIAASISRRAMSTPVPDSQMSGEDKSLNRMSRTESIVSDYFFGMLCCVFCVCVMWYLINPLCTSLPIDIL